jgi:hypothetical protein
MSRASKIKDSVMPNLTIPNQNDVSQNVLIPKYEDTCPRCGYSINPTYIGGAMTALGSIELVFRCPRHQCKKFFITTYIQVETNSQWVIFSSLPKKPTEENFSEEIKSISPDFVNIYNQALEAEHQNLDQICGVGYRKALEFLIKDYLCKMYPDKADTIKKKQLGTCIREFLDSNNKIRTSAERAVWIGNDETHYVRKWTDKDLKDLKRLIGLSVHWISAEILTEQYEENMRND